MLVECGTVSEAARRLGYPSRTTFYHWIKNDNAAGKRVEDKIFSHYPAGIKEEAMRLVEGGLSNSGAASRLGISSPSVVYHWIKNARKGKQPMLKKPTPVIGAGSASDGFKGDKAERICQLELENDVLRGVVDLLKAESLEKLTNREKTLIIDSLRLKTEYPLKELTTFLKISKSSYEYQHKVILGPDKYLLYMHAHTRDIRYTRRQVGLRADMGRTQKRRWCYRAAYRLREDRPQDHGPRWHVGRLLQEKTSLQFLWWGARSAS